MTTEKFIVWADGRETDTRTIGAISTPDAIETACTLFSVEADQINVTTSGADARFYGARP